MKPGSLFPIPFIAVLVSACAGPAGPTYGYGPGPNPQPGYYWNGTIYVQGSNPYHNSGHYTRNVTNVNDVNVNRTNIHDRTVNNTSVNDRTVNRTNVNKTNVDKTNVNKAYAKHKPTHKPVQQSQASQNGGAAQ